MKERIFMQDKIKSNNGNHGESNNGNHGEGNNGNSQGGNPVKPAKSHAEIL